MRHRLLRLLLRGSISLLLLLALVFVFRAEILHRTAVPLAEWALGLELQVESPKTLTLDDWKINLQARRLGLTDVENNDDWYLDLNNINVTIDIANIFNRAITVSSIRTDSVAFKVNNDFFQNLHVEEEGIDWDWRVGSVSLGHVEFFRLDAQDKILDSADFSVVTISPENEAGTREVHLEGRYNEEKLFLFAELENLRAYLFDDQNLEVDLKLRSRDFTLYSAGSIPADLQKEQAVFATELLLHQLERLKRWVPSSIDLQGRSKILADITVSPDGIHLPELNISSKGRFGRLEFEGSIDHINDLERINIDGKVDAQINQLEGWAENIGLACPDCKQADLLGQVSGDPNQLSLKDFELSVTLPEGKASLKGDQLGYWLDLWLAGKEGALIIDGELTLDIPELTPWIKAYDITCDTCKSLKATSRLRTHAQQLELHNLDLNFESAETQLRYQDKRLQIDLSRHNQNSFIIGANNASLRWIFADDIDPISYLIDADTAKLKWNARSWSMAIDGHMNGLPLKFDGQQAINEAVAFSGTVGTSEFSGEFDSEQEVPELSVALQVNDLQDLATATRRPQVDADKASLIAVAHLGDTTYVPKFTISVERDDTTIKLDGKVQNLEDFEKYDLNLSINTEQIASFQRWLNTNLMPLAQTIEAFEWASTFNAEFDSQQAVLKDDWLIDTIDSIQISEWLSLLPITESSMKLDMQIIDDDQGTHLKDFTLNFKQDNADIAWQGQFLNVDKEEQISGKITSRYEKGFWPRLAATIQGEADISGNFEHQIIRSLKLETTDTLIQGEIDLIHEEAINRFIAKLYTDRINTAPWLDPVIANEADDPFQEEANDSIPEKEEPSTFSLSLFDGYEVDLSMEVDELLHPKLHLSDMAMKLSANTQDAELKLGGQLESGKLDLQTSVEKQGKDQLWDININLGTASSKDINRMVGQELTLGGDIDLHMNITAKGETFDELLASSNGQLNAYSLNLVTDGALVDDLSPDILVSTVEKINPFYEPERTGKIECAAVGFDITNGIWEADESILVVTPQVHLAAFGELNFKKRELRFLLAPRTRRGLGISVSGIAANMAVIEGPFANPKASIDAKRAALEGGKRYAGLLFFGPLFPLYIGQVNKYLASSDHCKKLVAELARQSSNN